MDIFEGKSYCIWSKSSFSGSISYKSEGYSFEIDQTGSNVKKMGFHHGPVMVLSKSATWKLIL